MKRKLYCVFIDFSKAFDTVWRCGLWIKLIKSNIGGKCFKIIYNMYQNIKSCISHNNVLSSFFEIGVRQGENLSPFLFALYLNDLESFLSDNDFNGLESVGKLLEEHVHIYVKLLLLLYADDTVILAESSGELQLALNVFAEYCQSWKLKVNISKTKIVIFSKGVCKNYPIFHFNNDNIDVVKEYIYLGILFSCNLDCQLKLFDQLVQPILLYSSEVWGFENITCLERLHLKFCKYVLKVKMSTPDYMVYGELDRYPLSICIKTRMISFWCNLLQSPQKLSYKIYSLMYNLRNSNPKYNFNLLNSFEGILRDTGFFYVWSSQNFNSPHYLKSSIKRVLIDQFYQLWTAAQNDSSKAQYYKIYKEKPCMEPYLLDLPINLRIWLTRFKTANHRLPIETGRWNKVDKNKRLCK